MPKYWFLQNLVYNWLFAINLANTFTTLIIIELMLEIACNWFIFIIN